MSFCSSRNDPLLLFADNVDDQSALWDLVGDAATQHLPMVVVYLERVGVFPDFRGVAAPNGLNALGAGVDGNARTGGARADVVVGTSEGAGVGVGVDMGGRRSVGFRPPGTDIDRIDIPYPPPENAKALREWRQRVFKSIPRGGADVSLASRVGQLAQVLDARRVGQPGGSGRPQASRESEEGPSESDLRAMQEAQESWEQSFGVDFLIELADRGVVNGLNRLYSDWSRRVHNCLRTVRRDEGSSLPVSRALHAIRMLALLSVFSSRLTLPKGILSRFLRDGHGLGRLEVPPSFSGLARSVAYALSEFSAAETPIVVEAVRAGGVADSRGLRDIMREQEISRYITVVAKASAHTADAAASEASDESERSRFASPKELLVSALCDVPGGNQLCQLLVELPGGEVTLPHPFLAYVILHQLLLPVDDVPPASCKDLAWPPALAWLSLDFLLNWLHRFCENVSNGKARGDKARGESSVAYIKKIAQGLLYTRVGGGTHGGHRGQFSPLILALAPPRELILTEAPDTTCLQRVLLVSESESVTVSGSDAEEFMSDTPSALAESIALLKKTMDQWAPSPLLQTMRTQEGYEPSGCLLLVAHEIVCRDAFAAIHLLRFIQREKKSESVESAVQGAKEAMGAPASHQRRCCATFQPLELSHQRSARPCRGK
jgi:hypothetical protein